jgi:oligopeptide transport system permease protein
VTEGRAGSTTLAPERRSTPVDEPPGASAPPEGPWRAGWRRLRANLPARIALDFVAVCFLASLLAPLWPLPSPIRLDLERGAEAPVAPWTRVLEPGFRAEYWELNALDRALVATRQAIFGERQTAAWLGTDTKGRDLLSRVVWGSRTSILAALAAAATSLVIGVTWGAFAGLAGGRTDDVMMRTVDVLYSIPFVFAVIFLITLVGSWRAELAAVGIGRETVFYLVIGAIYWLSMARVVRGQVLALRRAEFVDAARVLGAGTARILFVHVLPNVLSIVVVYLTLTIPAVMLFEAFLSFLGLGIEPPKVSWGLLAVDGAEALNPVRLDWWLVVVPAAAMGSVLLALNVLGDGLRDALDPKLEERRA